MSFFSLLMFLFTTASSQETSTDFRTLLLQLANPETSWAATSRLQKLGAPTAAALVANLRRDSFRNNFHGNHSPTMLALDKLGDSAVPEIERALTPALLRSTNAEDIRFVETLRESLATIGGSAAAPVLIRIALFASDERTRQWAFMGLLPQTVFGLEANRGPWEGCLTTEDRYTCPLDPEMPQTAAAVRPLLWSVLDRIGQEPEIPVKIAAAQVLMFWGEGSIKSTGEQHLLALDASRGASRRAVVESLFKERNDRYVPLTIDLIKLQTTDKTSRTWAFQFAGRSRNVAFVPTLIDLLSDPEWNGNATFALRTLTFQDLGRDPQAWRDWWAANRTVDSNVLLARRVESLLPRLAAAEPRVMNDQVMKEWMNELEYADDPAVLPFVTAYLRHPKAGGADTSAVLKLLLNLTSQGSTEARQLLYECSDRSDSIAISCARVVAVFDRQRAGDRLHTLLNQPYRYGAAKTLVELGDSRGIPTLIDSLKPGNEDPSPAYVVLRRYTQEDIPEDVEAWRRWWQNAAGTFTVKTKAARIDISFCCRR